MMNINTPKAHERLKNDIFSSEGVIELGYFEEYELNSFSELIRRRLSLPTFFGGYWACYECPFTSDDLHIMAEHIISSHAPAPIGNTEEEVVI